MRKDPTSSNCDVVVPIKWCAEEQRWELRPTVVATSVRVHSGVMPLRMCLREGGDEWNIDDFLDVVVDPLLEAAWLKQCAQGDSGASGGKEKSDNTDNEDTWEVEKIVNKQTKQSILSILIYKSLQTSIHPIICPIIVQPMHPASQAAPEILASSNSANTSTPNLLDRRATPIFLDASLHSHA